MELLTRRYRSLTALVLVIAAELLLLGYQVRTREDVRLIRVWAVTAMAPLAQILESVHHSGLTLLDRYLLLVGAQRENERLREEIGLLKREAQFLRQELGTAERAQALALFQSRTPSRMVAARTIGAATGVGAKAVFIDRGVRDGVARGMAVVTPDGIVGRVRAAYPSSSQVVLITDPDFAAGVVSVKNHVSGTIKGQGESLCRVDYVQNEAKVEPGEWFYTSGDDRVFPKGLPVGVVQSVKRGGRLKEILVAPSGFDGGIEEVLVVFEGVHQPLPETAAGQRSAELLPPPQTPEEAEPPEPGGSLRLRTDADRLLERYREEGRAQGLAYGGLPAAGTRPDSPARPAPGEGGAPAAPAAPAGAPPRAP
jgi:rod shape-determining protein MreC